MAVGNISSQAQQATAATQCQPAGEANGQPANGQPAQDVGFDCRVDALAHWPPQRVIEAVSFDASGLDDFAVLFAHTPQSLSMITVASTGDTRGNRYVVPGLGRAAGG